MAGKKKQDKDKGWVGEMENYSRQIWLAGLGAYAKMGKEGAKLFETLVQDGEEAEKAARSEIDKQVDLLKARVGKTKAQVDADPVDTVKAKVDKSRGKLLDRWGELETVFDKRLNSAVSRLGVPSRAEVKALEDKVDALSRSVLELLEGKRAPAKVAPKAKPNAVAGGIVAQTSPRVVEESLADELGKSQASPRRRAANSAASAATGKKTAASSKAQASNGSKKAALNKGTGKSKSASSTKAASQDAASSSPGESGI